MEGGTRVGLLWVDGNLSVSSRDFPGFARDDPGPYGNRFRGKPIEIVLD